MSDWTVEAADTIERAVATVRERTVEPVQAATRAVVFGLLAGFFAVSALALLALAGFRLLTLGVPVWAAWSILGGIFVLGGAFLWAKRSAPQASPQE